MYQIKHQRISHRIISVYLPWIQPNIDGLQTTGTESRGKLAISMEESYFRIEHLFLDTFNETQTLQKNCNRFLDRPPIESVFYSFEQ